MNAVVMVITLFKARRVRENDVLECDRGLVWASSKQIDRGVGDRDRAVIVICCEKVFDDFVI